MADRNWPHPVLESDGIDYPGRAFQVAPKVRHIGGNYVISAEMEVGSETLLNEIAQGRAQYALKVHCPMTSYRRVAKGSDKEITITLPDATLFNSFYLQGFVIATQAFDLRSDEFDDVFADYGFPVTKGVVLAVADEQEFDADKSPDGLRHIRSMFRILRWNDPAAKLVALDLTKERIIIQVPDKDYDLYNTYKDQSPQKESFVAALVFPTLVQALLTLKRDADAGSDLRWQVGLRRKVEEAGHEVVDEGTAFEIAQELLGYPVTKYLIAIDREQQGAES